MGEGDLKMASRSQPCGMGPADRIGLDPPLSDEGFDLQADLDLLGGLVLHLEDGHPLKVGAPLALAAALRRVLSLAYPDNQPSDGESA